MSANSNSRFKRWLLPGLGVKAVVIGGGYATGRELAEFFLSERAVGRTLCDPVRDAPVQHLLLVDLRSRTAPSDVRLQELLQAAARPCLASLRIRLRTVRRADPGRLRSRGRRDRQCCVRRSDMGRNRRPRGRNCVYRGVRK